MDTVILAAGKGERLDGITAPYHKPLMVVNGKPVVQQAVDFAIRLGGRPVVVVAPDNAAPISHVLGNRNVFMVVQRKPTGPGRALALGLQLCRRDKVMVLMGDNISTWDDVDRVAGGSIDSYGIGVQLVDDEAATRFTYWRPETRRWVEKVPPKPADFDPASGKILAWVGPVVINHEKALEHYADGLYSDIGPSLGDLIPYPGEHTRVEVKTYDIGVPEMTP